METNHLKTSSWKQDHLETNVLETQVYGLGLANMDAEGCIRKRDANMGAEGCIRKREFIQESNI